MRILLNYLAAVTGALSLFLAAPEPATAVEPAQDLMAQEQEFLRALQSATTWKIVRGMLDVHRADGERVLTASEAGE